MKLSCLANSRFGKKKIVFQTVASTKRVKKTRAAWQGLGFEPAAKSHTYHTGRIRRREADVTVPISAYQISFPT